MLWDFFSSKCLFGHDWEYGTEKVTYKRIGSYHRQSNGDTLDFEHRSRYCSKCCKKQIQLIGGGWNNWGLTTTQEKRDKKLNDLGI